MTAKISGMVSPFLLPPGFMGMVRSFSASADGKWAADPLGRDVDRITRGNPVAKSVRFSHLRATVSLALKTQIRRLHCKGKRGKTILY